MRVSLGIPTLLAACAACAAAPFRHPGVLNTQEELDFIKAKVNGLDAHAMKQGFARLKAWHGASLNYPVKPEATVEVLASAVGPSEQNFRDAAHAAYAHALQWVVTGDARHRDKALQVVNGWGATFKGMSPETENQKDLEAAWALPTWAAAAEILRHHAGGSAGWKSEDIARFDGMVDILAGYSARTLARKSENNWATSSCLALMAAGVFQDDTVRFHQGYDYLIALLPKTVEKTGLLMETCRDCNHAEYNLLGVMAAAEVAWKQGRDLYGIKLDGQATPRLLMGMEFHAAALLGKPLDVGQSCGPRNCSGEDRKASGWEVAFNHYRHRARIEAPNTEGFVLTHNRPDALSEDHFTGWTTLTHGDLGDIRTPLGPAPSASPPYSRTPALTLVRSGPQLMLRFQPKTSEAARGFTFSGRSLLPSP